MLLGAVAFSVILFCIQQTEFDLVSHLSHSRLEFFLGLLPFFWIVSLILFLVVAMTSFKHSGKGTNWKPDVWRPTARR
jgi:Trk-type K+ transport system membrane component